MNDLAVSRRPERMGAAMRLAGMLLLLPILAFCAFGFLASFEGSDVTYWVWRVAYVLIASATFATSVLLLRGAVAQRTSRTLP